MEPGEIVAVVGVVGSGKSSLVNAMIGEMMTISGTVKYNGTLAFIAQNVPSLSQYNPVGLDHQRNHS